MTGKKQPLIRQPARKKESVKGKKRSWSKFIIPALIFISCFVLYGNTLHNEYALDDNIYTYSNSFVAKGFSAFNDIFDKGSLYGFDKDNAGQYRPLALLSFMAEVSLFGFKPHLSHFFNVLLFAFTVVLLYFFLQKILRNYKPGIVIAATLLFAFHPIHTEVVANIKSRDEILGFFFGLVSFYCILLYQEKNKMKYYFFSLTAFFAAIFCKENCLTYAVIIPLILYFFTGLEIKKIALKSLPYFALVGIYLFIRSRVLQNITFSHQIPLIDNALLATNSSADRIATSFVLLGKYIYMTIIPYPLSWDYSYNQIPVVSWGNIKPILSVLLCAVMIGFMLWGIKKKLLFSFLIALFFITLLLSSNIIIRIASTFGERFLYVPSLSFCIALPVLTANALKQTSFFILMGCLLIIYMLIVIPRNPEWKSDFTIDSSGVITSPNSARTHYALATVYVDSAQHSQASPEKEQYYSFAFQEFRKALKIYPVYDGCYYNMGICYYDEGYQDSAIKAYKKTLEINPGYSQAANNLGVIYFKNTRYDLAFPYFLMSYKTDTDNLGALKNIIITCQSAKNYPLAIHYDSLLLMKDPENEAFARNLQMLKDSARYKNKNRL